MSDFNSTSNKHAQLVNGVTALLMDFSEGLAEAWATQPFRRVDLARAFARGFVKNPEDDPHPTALLVLKVAMLDQDLRRGLR